MQLHAYLTGNQMSCIINSHMQQAVTILIGIKNNAMRQIHTLLVVQHNFHICMSSQQLEEAGI